MTIDKDKMLKITIAVGEELVGGKFIKPNQYEEYRLLIDAIQNNDSISIIKVENGDPIYKVGTKLSGLSPVVGPESSIEVINDTMFAEVFFFVSNMTLIFVDVLQSELFESLIAAYQSDPTISIEEVPLGQFS